VAPAGRDGAAVAAYQKGIRTNWTPSRLARGKRVRRVASAIAPRPRSGRAPSRPVKVSVLLKGWRVSRNCA